MEAELSANEPRVQQIRLQAKDLATRPTSDSHDINKKYFSHFFPININIFRECK